MKTAHLTSAHPRRDARIFLKECSSLARAGYDAHLVVADGLGNSAENGVTFTDVGKASGRLSRMVGAAYRVFAAGLKLDADVYHLHDPELLPYAVMLKLKGKTVIFDAHEDLPRQILSKHYLPVAVRKTTSVLAEAGQKSICRRLDFVVAATPVIAQSFRAMGVASEAINNFPLPGELEMSAATRSRKKNQVCYIGGITTVRGIRQIISALGLVKSGVRLTLAGNFAERELEKELMQTKEWKHVDATGFVSRDKVRSILEESIAGLVTLLPTRAYLDSLPVKMFEYMAAGLPVIASDFPLWREIVDDADCGVLVDPEDPQAIADAIDTIVNDPEMARRMGENGARAVREKYNWGIEEKKLLAVYSKLVGPPQKDAGPVV
ncbi:glycosyltransferase [Mesorhizobium denitrificans]|uniref:Glycosyltransferase n=1 Tax=Mesorhizobium denitrificans TaxID=2294114 RepID=A0A371XCV5_9HYPH|nr:glycosyltransferase [Mesorhizobium denitrificans]